MQQYVLYLYNIYDLYLSAQVEMDIIIFRNPIIPIGCYFQPLRYKIRKIEIKNIRVIFFIILLFNRL